MWGHNGINRVKLRKDIKQVRWNAMNSNFTLYFVKAQFFSVLLLLMFNYNMIISY